MAPAKKSISSIKRGSSKRFLLAGKKMAKQQPSCRLGEEIHLTHSGTLAGWFRSIKIIPV
jgi:hypothetical protein